MKLLLQDGLLPGFSAANTIPFLLAVTLVSYRLYSYYLSRKTSKLPFPPGPRGVAILGMTGEVMAPKKKHASLFEDWEREAGGNGIMMFPTLFRKQVIISDAKAAQTILEKRGTLYADRVPNHYFDKLRADSCNLVAMEGGDDVVKIRKLFHEQMSPKAVVHWRQLQSSNAYYTALELLHMPETMSISDVFEKTQKKLTLKTFCGNVDKATFDFVKNIEDEMDRMPVPPIAPLLDLFPSLQNIPANFPGGGFKRDAKAYVKLGRRMWDRLRDQVKAQASDPSAPPSLWGNLFQTDAFKRYGYSDDDASLIIGHQLGSNLVPTIILQVFVLAMLRFPEVFRRAQEEIDRVVGRERLPTVHDEQYLPYIRALQCEVIRWRPVVPLVQPHLASQDDEYEGLCIPKGALVWANLQAMSRNEQVYPEPNQLRPERFLNADGSFARKEEISIFGYGKR
ncbi:hypothetical protein EMMF5_002351 [Cystobasidiomycetes sp. EMM_F5]